VPDPGQLLFIRDKLQLEPRRAQQEWQRDRPEALERLGTEQLATMSIG
jgi:hypothetical protein